MAQSKGQDNKLTHDKLIRGLSCGLRYKICKTNQNKNHRYKNGKDITLELIIVDALNKYRVLLN